VTRVFGLGTITRTFFGGKNRHRYQDLDWNTSDAGDRADPQQCHVSCGNLEAPSAPSTARRRITVHISKPDSSPSLHPLSLLSPSPVFYPFLLHFFHLDGADAVILTFDVNQPTLRTLNRWWSEFCACRPLSDEEIEQYPLVVVGNKTDLAPSSTGSVVPESQKGLCWTSSTNSPRYQDPHPVAWHTGGRARLDTYARTCPRLQRIRR
jgi:hypothetical protein